MGVLAFCSAKGAPGTTTAALLTAALWPRPVLLVDADPAGGDVALRLPAPSGRPLDRDRGILSLLPLARRTLDPAVLFRHAQEIAGGVPVLAGLAGPEQAEAARGLWPVLADALRRVPGADVVVDAGQVHPRSVHLPLLREADVVAVVLRPRVGAVVRLRERLAGLEPALARRDGSRPRVGLVVVAGVDDRDSVSAAVHGVHAAAPFVEFLGRLALDARGAAVFEGAAVRHPRRTMLVRSGAELAAGLLDLLPEPPPLVLATSPVAEPPRPVGTVPIPVVARAGPEVAARVLAGLRGEIGPVLAQGGDTHPGGATHPEGGDTRPEGGDLDAGPAPDPEDRDPGPGPEPVSGSDAPSDPDADRPGFGLAGIWPLAVGEPERREETG